MLTKMIFCTTVMISVLGGVAGGALLGGFIGGSGVSVTFTTLTFNPRPMIGCLFTSL